MTVIESAKREAHKASRSTVLEWATRIGFVGYGIMHVAVAWLALQIMLGHSTPDGGQTGAFRTVAEQPLGRVIVTITAVGLVAMAIWQMLLAAVGHRQERGWRRPAERVASAGRTVIYTLLAITAWQVLRGNAKPSAEQQEDMTNGLLHIPAGGVLVVVAGVLIVALGLGMALYGFKKMFVRRLQIRRMPDTVGEATIRLGQFGYIAKGIAFTAVGALVVIAGATADPQASGGLDDALKILARQPYGEWLLAVISAGFAAFGVYSFAQSGYRKIREDNRSRG